jgi:hypothetical protein
MLQGKDRNRNIVIIVVALIVLCCCCTIASYLGWTYGDQLMATSDIIQKIAML